MPYQGSASAPHSRPDTLALATRRQFVIGGVFAGVSAASLALTPRATASPIAKGDLERLIPKELGPWTFASSSGLVLPPPDALSDRIYDKVVTGTYQAPGEPAVMLLVAYSPTQDGMLQVHRPEFCYQAGGYSLSPTTDLDLPASGRGNVGANAFLADGPSGREMVLYWTRIGDKFPQGWLVQRTAVMAANLRGRIPDGLLARVSCLSPQGTDTAETLRSFVVALDRAAPPALRALLFGSAPR